MDRIVYLCVSKPGGVDGRDASDKGGVIMSAAWNEETAQKAANPWVAIEKRILGDDDLIPALEKIDPLDRLMLSAPIWQGARIAHVFSSDKRVVFATYDATVVEAYKARNPTLHYECKITDKEMCRAVRRMRKLDALDMLIIYDDFLKES